MNEPTTEAGRRLRNEFGPEDHEVNADILAIEAEARAPLVAALERHHAFLQNEATECGLCRAALREDQP